MDRIDRRIAQLPPRIRRPAGAARLALREPTYGLDRALARARGLLGGGGESGHLYAVQEDWHRRLHEQLSLPWPCAATAELETLWEEIAELVEMRGLRLGRGTYAGWDDGDPGLARSVWCLVRNLAPAKVVETGVARGITSRVILEALQRNGSGHLWSIDLPASDPSLHSEIGVAVSDGVRDRWTYLQGMTRRRLPGLLREIRPIDLFIHDSSHTERNVRFELVQAWTAICQGVIVADDVQQSAGFASFTDPLPKDSWLVGSADDASALFGIAFKGLQPVAACGR